MVAGSRIVLAGSGTFETRERAARKRIRELTASVPLRRDDGSAKLFVGHSFQHNLNRGPPKAGSAEHCRGFVEWIRTSVPQRTPNSFRGTARTRRQK